MSGAEAKIRGVVARAEGPNPQHGKAAVDLLSAELSGIRQEAAAAAEHRWLLSLQSWDVVTAFRVAIRQKGRCSEASLSIPSATHSRLRWVVTQSVGIVSRHQKTITNRPAERLVVILFRAECRAEKRWLYKLTQRRVVSILREVAAEAPLLEKLSPTLPQDRQEAAQ